MIAEVQLMSRRHSNLGSGPPRGPGHYSEDGRRWWENGHRRWFPVTDQEDELEIEVEDIGATSLPARLWTTLVTQYGTRYCRFVGQARSADSRWPTYRAIGASFPATGLEDPSGKGAWATEQQGRLEELHQQLLREGWRLVGRGDHWWSRRYRRPVVELTGAGPAEAGARAVG
jgi:hypothetical protein